MIEGALFIPPRFEPPWHMINIHAEEVAKQILDSGSKPKCVCVIARGGLVVAGMILQHLPQVPVIAVRIAGYQDADETHSGHTDFILPNNWLNYGCVLPDKKKFKDVLFIDDIVDRGHSLNRLQKYARPYGDDLRVACLYVKGDNVQPHPAVKYWIPKKIHPQTWVHFPWEPEKC